MEGMGFVVVDIRASNLQEAILVYSGWQMSHLGSRLQYS